MFALNEGTRLYCEETGGGPPVIFVHEFGGDYRSWEAQVRYLSRFHRCITFNARGYPPSDVPADPGTYSQDIFVEDVRAVLDELGVDQAHLVGLSMGSASVLGFTLRYPQRARSMVLCGCGYGSVPAQREAWLRSNAEMAENIVQDPKATAEAYAHGPTRLPYKRKDPRGWAEFLAALEGLDPLGASLTLKGVQPSRPGVFELQTALATLDVPSLLVVGDEDEPALEPALFMKRTIPGAGLWMFPRTGHAVNTEEPALFNRALLEFFGSVDSERWPER